MASSTQTQDSCICVYAFPGPRKTTNPDQDQLVVQVSISLAAVQKNPVTKRSPKIHQTSAKTFQHPRQAFISATHDEQGDIIRNMIQGPETAFPLENMNWGLSFPADETASELQNLDEIISGRLSGIARSCAVNNQIGYMDIRILKLEKLENEAYHQLCAPAKQPLDDWILENQENVNLIRSRCLWFINKLARESPRDNQYYGLRSVKMEEESGHIRSCSICIKGFKINTQAIRMPCSHIFHGFCIFQWLQKSTTCPLCRFQLFGFNPRQKIC